MEIQCSRISQRGLSALNMPNSKDAECAWSLTEYFHKSEFMSNLGDFLFFFFVCLFLIQNSVELQQMDPVLHGNMLVFRSGHL